jgi:hypothetical protein
MKKSTKSEKPAAPQVKSANKKTVEPAPVKKTVAPKKIPTPKKAALAAAPAPTVVLDVPSPVAAPASPVVADTTILAQIDVGFGNQLFIRGEGPGLSWEQGAPMTCVGDDRWAFTVGGASKPVVFKFLLNDRSWSAGEDYSVAPGATVVLTPTF